MQLSKIIIALLQLTPGNSLVENMYIGIAACRKAKNMGADIALFPEMWSIGYEIPESVNELKSKAISKNDAFIHSFSDLAKELQMAIGRNLSSISRHIKLIIVGKLHSVFDN